MLALVSVSQLSLYIKFKSNQIILSREYLDQPNVVLVCIGLMRFYDIYRVLRK